MKKFIFYTLLFISGCMFSQNEKLFEEGNKAYQQGKYEVAVSKYEQIIDKGEASADLYYNLGNAHYKLNHIAPSIFYYEKALQLKPGDNDIQNNIKFAKNMAIDDIETVEKTGLSESWNNLVRSFSFSTWAWLAILFSVLFVAMFLLYYFSGRSVFKRIYFGLSMLAILLCITSVFIGFQQKSSIEDNEFAIVFSEEAEVRDEPNLRGNASFTLHEGTKARLLEDYQQWYKIELANGAQGWIDREHIRKL
ncbi:tetratricopeptide repeat protein [Gramella sp. AN32]|uniref:Tetratricopeptide repeat protein n=1 Tax=Christiangramia antarctica TaxID=2058158 RepID=A0ABW5WZB4_9FLAO|nr:tetratricopeptide repeat protein [Gramella sp. AN32]MCM4154888.1 ion channel protein [Gramella sp. AN32]